MDGMRKIKFISGYSELVSKQNIEDTKNHNWRKTARKKN